MGQEPATSVKFVGSNTTGSLFDANVQVRGDVLLVSMNANFKLRDFCCKGKVELKLLIMFVFAALALLPMFLLRDFTPSNELRYLSIVDEALQNGRFFAFTFNGEAYADKPPLYLWLMMLGKWLLGGHQMWYLSLLSFVPAVVIVWQLDRWFGPKLSNEFRFVAAIMTFSAAYFIGSGATVRMDMLMAMFIVLALRSFWVLVHASLPLFGEDTQIGANIQEPCSRSSVRLHKFLFPIYLFLALFTKGPYGLLIPLVVSLAYLVYVAKREPKGVRWRVFCKIWGSTWGWLTWSIVLVLCAIWFYAVWLEGGAEYLNNLLFHQTIGRGVKAFAHQKPFYYYLLVIWYCLLPWVLAVLVPMALWVYRRLKGATHGSDEQHFVCIAALGTLVLVSCVSSKLAIYLLPGLPFFVYAGLFAWQSLGSDIEASVGNNIFVDRLWFRVLLLVPVGIFALALPVLCILMQVGVEEWIGSPLTYGAAAILTIGSAIGFGLICRAKAGSGWLAHSVACVFGGMFGAAALVGLDMPRMNPYIGYEQICMAAQEEANRLGCNSMGTWRMRRVAGLDVYLGHRPTEVDGNKDLMPQITEPMVLMAPATDIRKLNIDILQEIGPFAVVYVEPKGGDEL